MPSRRERAIERVDAIDLEETRAWLRRDWMAAAIEAYEAEIAADLESEETVERAQYAYSNHRFPIAGHPSRMRAALKAALEER